jgi:hypothetical protein
MAIVTVTEAIVTVTEAIVTVTEAPISGREALSRRSPVIVRVVAWSRRYLTGTNNAVYLSGIYKTLFEAWMKQNNSRTRPSGHWMIARASTS